MKRLILILFSFLVLSCTEKREEANIEPVKPKVYPIWIEEKPNPLIGSWKCMTTRKDNTPYTDKEKSIFVSITFHTDSTCTYVKQYKGKQTTTNAYYQLRLEMTQERGVYEKYPTLYIGGGQFRYNEPRSPQIHGLRNITHTVFWGKRRPSKPNTYDMPDIIDESLTIYK